MKNALKFTKKGQIRLLAAYDNKAEMLSVHVIDNGVGIAHKEFDKLFKKFGKLKRTALTNSEGIGLGLMICQKLVLLNGGTIKVQSKGKNKGSMFSFDMEMKMTLKSKREKQAWQLL